MNHYLDLRLRPDPEIATSHLFNAVYGKLHLALVSGNHTDIGVSFPRSEESAPLLGNTLRLHGSAEVLARFISSPWLGHLAEHVGISSVRQAPPVVAHRAVRRIQVKSSPERLRRRYVRRHGVSQEEAVTLIPDSVAECTDLPYLRVRSTSTGNNFRLFIQHGKILAQPVPGEFNSYGLGAGATVPWF
jgi:CRISPR-associated endonuclease Csy4